MRIESAPPTTEDLLAQQEWLRRLAGSLVRDPSAADDLAQQAVLTAVLHPPREAGALRGWLARVTRNLAHLGARGERRRARREEAVARPERLPSASVLLERVEIQRMVTDEVLRLAEPYRATLLLRFYQDVSAREIAAAQGVPAGTVRSRMKRGLEILRARLDDRSGGDRTLWLEGLAPLALPLHASPAAGATLPGLSGGILVMKKVIAAVVIGAACLTALWYVLPLDSVRPPEAAAGPADVAVHADDEKLHGGEEAREERDDPELAIASRTPVEIEPGSIRGRLTWKEDGTPVVGAEVYVRRLPKNDAPRVSPHFRTDADGIFVSRDLVPGEYGLSTDHAWGEMTVEVEPGSERTVEVALDSPGVLSVLVQDTSGQPVADADIWQTLATGAGSGFVVGRTGEDGRATVRLTGPTVFLTEVSARKAGYSPSDMMMPARTLEVPPGSAAPSDPEEFVLILTKGGGSLRGRVLAPDAKPLAGAAVMASARTDTCGCRPFAGCTEPLSVSMSTDVDGVFLFEGMTAGWLRVAAYAPGFAPTTQDVLVGPGERTECDFALERGASVRGIVRDPAGAPVPGVLVLITDHAGMVTNPQAVTRPDGSYRLRDVTPGRVLVSVHGSRGGPREHPWMAKSAVLAVRSGEELEWSPTLRRKASIRGRLVDVAGNSLANWRVSVRPSSGGRGPTTDRDGRFTIPGCEDRSYTLSVPTTFGPRGQEGRSGVNLSRAEAAAGWRLVIAPEEVLPGGEEVTVVVSRKRIPVEQPAVVAGVLVDSSGSPLGGESVRVGRVAVTPAVTEAATGRFEIDGIGRGTHTLEWDAANPPGPPLRHALRSFEVEEGEFLDLGEVEVPEFGDLVVRLEPPAGFHLRSVRIGLRREDTPEEIRWGMDLRREKHVEFSLPEGSYLLSFDIPGVTDEWVAFAIEAGKETALDVTLQVGARVRLRPVGTTTESLVFQVREELRGLVVQKRVSARGLTCGGTHELRLGPGDYEVEVSTDAGQRGSARFRILPNQPFEKIIDIELRDDPGGR